MKKMLVVLSVLGFALAMTGCGGPSCKDLCEKGNACAGATQTDCTTSCDKADTLNSASSCTSKYDDLLSCMDDNSSKICDENNTSCTAEALAYVSCVIDLCTNNPTNSACAS